MLVGTEAIRTFKREFDRKGLGGRNGRKWDDETASLGADGSKIHLLQFNMTIKLIAIVQKIPQDG